MIDSGIYQQKTNILNKIEIYNKILSLSYSCHLKMSYPKLNWSSSILSLKEESDKIFQEKDDELQNLHIISLNKQASKMNKKMSIHEKQNIFNEVNALEQKQHSEDSSDKPKNSYKSPYHNLQKHTVTTILQIITIKKTSEDSLSEQAAYEMWRIFLKSNAKTKKILSILYGKTEFNQIIRQRFVKCGFQKILNEYSENTILNAQNILREITVEQMTQQKILRNLKHRHVTNQQNLLIYIKNFLEELKNGAIKLRIDEKTSKNLQENFNTLNHQKTNNFY